MYNVKHLKEIICFAGGLVFGTAGVKLLASKDAKKAYVHTIAAGLRMKECVMETVNKVQENAEDVLAAAKDINEKRAEEDAANLVEADDEDVLNNGKEA
ncbi:MAG: DUF6110 family protein [Eubacteriales bacterium]|nr:DUF6110 family protein [Eubacteriales bacterium]